MAVSKDMKILRRLRDRDGLSLSEIERRTGITRKTLRGWLNTSNKVESKPRRRQVADDKDLRHQVKDRHAKANATKLRWMEWIYEIEHDPSACSYAVPSDALLISMLNPHPNNPRKKLLSVLAHDKGFSASATAKHLGISRRSVCKYLTSFDTGGIDALIGRKQKDRRADDETFKQALFSLLHEPPSLSGFNRTTWRMDDLRSAMNAIGHKASDSVIREVISKAGFRWRSAKVVLTSSDPSYREKLERVQNVLSNLGEQERFFSIDEFGPFAVKAKPGRVLSEPGLLPSVPQWQKSKGWLIATAALELSANQITHFYSKAKNTTEMIRMAKVLLEEYRDAKKLYLSWDAASWHMSKELLAFVDEHNGNAKGFPTLELVPLPASAQFLNVIESVFSGMARAIIHSSDYPTVKAATDAIDRYFDERNQHYRDNPKKAGKKIWGLERTKAAFDPSNNCKDPDYR